MGVRAGFSEITPEVFAQVAAGAQPDITPGIRHSIDKAWHDFHVVFRSKGPPLSLAIAGDYRHPLSPHSLDEFCDGRYHEYYVGFASPQLVQEVAEALAKVTASDYKRWETELVGDQYSMETFFPTLKTAYLEAAVRRNALMIVIS